MKVVAFNGSVREKGNTAILLNTALILDGREGETRVMDAWGAWSPQDLHPGKGEGKP